MDGWCWNTGCYWTGFQSPRGPEGSFYGRLPVWCRLRSEGEIVAVASKGDDGGTDWLDGGVFVCGLYAVVVTLPCWGVETGSGRSPVMAWLTRTSSAGMSVTSGRTNLHLS